MTEREKKTETIKLDAGRAQTGQPRSVEARGHDIMRAKQTDLWERGHPIVLICLAQIAFLLSSQVLELN